jgi:hypothetical protein
VLGSRFTPVTSRVTIKLRVVDPSGYFLPNIRPENFAVYEDGVQQKDVSVEIGMHPSSHSAELLENCSVNSSNSFDSI